MPVSAPSVVAACPRCGSTFPGALCNTPAPIRCPACEAMVQLEIYPAFLRPAAPGATAEPVLEEGVSSCFYHEGKKAVIHCDACGRFLCALCDLDLGGRHLCPQCLQAGPKKGALPQLETSRTLYDGMALILALLSGIPGIHFLTAPAAFGMGVMAFFKPPSLVRRTRARAVLAMILATVLGVGWTWVMFFGD